MGKDKVKSGKVVKKRDVNWKATDIKLQALDLFTYQYLRNRNHHGKYKNNINNEGFMSMSDLFQFSITDDRFKGGKQKNTLSNII